MIEKLYKSGGKYEQEQYDFIEENKGNYKSKADFIKDMDDTLYSLKDPKFNKKVKGEWEHNKHQIALFSEVKKTLSSPNLYSRGGFTINGRMIMKRFDGVGDTTYNLIKDDRGEKPYYTLEEEDGGKIISEGESYYEVNEISNMFGGNYAKGGKVKKGNEMLIGGLAGILFGFLLNK